MSATALTPLLTALRTEAGALRLESDRLRFRLPHPDDVPRIFEGYATDREAIRWLSFLSHESLATTLAVLLEWRQHWDQLSGELVLIIERKSDNAFLGVLSLDLTHGVSVGYVICRPSWGQGYATEALVFAIEAAFARLGVWRVWATCAVENAASRRVMEKAGLGLEGTLRAWVVSPLVGPAPRDSYCLSQTRDDWMDRLLA